MGHETTDASNVSRQSSSRLLSRISRHLLHYHSLACALTMPLPVGQRRCVVGVGIAVVAEVRAGVVLADVLGHDAAAGDALAGVFQTGMAALIV